MSWIWVSIKQLFLSFGLLRPVCEVHLREILVCEVGVHLRELFQVSLSAQPLFAKQLTAHGLSEPAVLCPKKIRLQGCLVLRSFLLSSLFHSFLGVFKCPRGEDYAHLSQVPLKSAHQTVK